jgi:uncharacterized membrane protein
MSRRNRKKSRNRNRKADNDLSNKQNNNNKKKNNNNNSEKKRAERRIELEREKRKKQDKILFSVIIVVILALAGVYFLMPMLSGNDGGPGPEPTIESPPPTASNEIKIPVSDVNDGDAHYYSYNSDGVKIRYFLLESNDGTIRAAFDTCDVCYSAKKGYRQEGDQMVCNNCGQRFDSNKINVEKGGCNPAPLMLGIGSKITIFNVLFLTIVSILMSTVIADGNSGGYCGNGYSIDLFLIILIGFVLVLLIALILKKLAFD